MSRFGGPSFGTPRQSRSSRSQEPSSEDAPPIESIYDQNGGSLFSAKQHTDEEISSSFLTPQKQPPTLASLPTAVIIFGFPSQMTTKVLDHFSRYGKIEEHTSSAAQNLSMGHNWMKITYADSSSAQKAVSANGTFVGGQYMIGCVYAQEDALASIEVSQDDAMDIDPQTPPRQKQQGQYRPAASSTPHGFSSAPRTPLRTPAPGNPDHTASRTPGGRKIEILSSDAIYKSNSPITERVPSWMPGWLSGTEEPKVAGTPEAAANGKNQDQSGGQPGWTGKILRGLVDTIFGF